MTTTTPPECKTVSLDGFQDEALIGGLASPVSIDGQPVVVPSWRYEILPTT